MICKGDRTCPQPSAIFKTRDNDEVDVFLSLVAEQEETNAFDYQRFRTVLRRRA